MLNKRMTNSEIAQRVIEIFNKPWLTKESQFLYLAVGGSRAYGLHSHDSDYDVIGVVCPPEENVIGLGKWESFQQVTEDVDVRLYSPKKFFTMMDQGGITNLEMLFLKPRILNPVMHPLMTNRGELLQPAVINSVLGHSTSTLHRFQDISNAKLGSKRRKYIETYGYDVSAAVHALRWLWMAEWLEFDPKHLNVPTNLIRADYLQKVKRGEIKEIRIIIEEARDRLEKRKEFIHEILRRNKKPDLSQMLVTLHRELLL